MTQGVSCHRYGIFKMSWKCISEIQKILIVGDSLAARRSTNPSDVVIWPELLGDRMSQTDIVNISKPYATSCILRKIKETSIDIAVLELGIVDCAPRKFSRLETKFLSFIPGFISKHVVKLLGRMPSDSRVYVCSSEYKKNIEIFCKSNKDNRIIIVEIMPASSAFLKKNPTAYLNISKYNDVLGEISNSIDNVNIVKTSDMSGSEFFLEDGYHLSPLGHVEVFERVIRCITDMCVH